MINRTITPITYSISHSYIELTLYNILEFHRQNVYLSTTSSPNYRSILEKADKITFNGRISEKPT